MNRSQKSITKVILPIKFSCLKSLKKTSFWFHILLTFCLVSKRSLIFPIIVIVNNWYYLKNRCWRSLKSDPLTLCMLRIKNYCCSKCFKAKLKAVQRCMMEKRGGVKKQQLRKCLKHQLYFGFLQPFHSSHLC